MKVKNVGNLISWSKHCAARPTIKEFAKRKIKLPIHIKGESTKNGNKAGVPLPELARGQPANTHWNRALPLIQIAKLLPYMNLMTQLTP